MTKDVLVSISGKHIDIMDDPARGYEVGEDGIEVVTPANYYCRNGKHYILYDEVLEGMAGIVTFCRRPSDLPCEVFHAYGKMSDLD